MARYSIFGSPDREMVRMVGRFDEALVRVDRPEGVIALLGRRVPGGNPNNSDAGGKSSIAIAEALLEELQIGSAVVAAPDPGPALEREVGAWLLACLHGLAPAREWEWGSTRIDAFSQYRHLRQVEDLVREHPTLRAEIGVDYLVSPDVTIGFPVPGDEAPFLHACVSCKWTLRSDRAQNVRHEAVILTRHRRGRQPHIVAVTAEPLPSRLASLARGTGEIDALYHVALPHLTAAVHGSGFGQQIEVLEEMTSQGRLRDITQMPPTLIL